MKKIYLLIFLLISSCILHAQNYPYCKAGLFSEYTYYSEISMTHDLDVVYGTNMDYLGNTQTLKMDLHYPSLVIDPLPKRPVIIMLHGGGFSSGSKNDMTAYCAKLGRAGYVAVSIDYRLGWNHLPLCNGNVSQLQYAMYRALQDTRAAIRFLVEKASDYRIDTNYIYIAGQSEGGMTAMNCAYMNQTEADIFMPGAFADLGSIDSATNNYYNTVSVKGVFNWCGAVIDTNIIQNDTQIPLLSIHGLLDSIMPVEYGKYLNCQNVNNPYPTLYGPKFIYARMKNMGICSEANYDANGEHCFFPSLEENVYIPAKFTCFFKNLMCGNCTTESKVSYNQKSCAESAPVSVSEVKDNIDFQIYPNPASLILNVKCLAPNKSGHALNGAGNKYKIELYSSVGVSVFSSLINDSKIPYYIDISGYAKGIYFLKLNVGNEIFYKKIIFN